MRSEYFPTQGRKIYYMRIRTWKILGQTGCSGREKSLNRSSSIRLGRYANAAQELNVRDVFNVPSGDPAATPEFPWAPWVEGVLQTSLHPKHLRHLLLVLSLILHHPCHVVRFSHLVLIAEAHALESLFILLEAVGQALVAFSFGLCGPVVLSWALSCRVPLLSGFPWLSGLPSCFALLSGSGCSWRLGSIPSSPAFACFSDSSLSPTEKAASDCLSSCGSVPFSTVLALKALLPFFPPSHSRVCPCPDYYFSLLGAGVGWGKRENREDTEAEERAPQAHSS